MKLGRIILHLKLGAQKLSKLRIFPVIGNSIPDDRTNMKPVQTTHPLMLGKTLERYIHWTSSRGVFFLQVAQS